MLIVMSARIGYNNTLQNHSHSNMMAMTEPSQLLNRTLKHHRRMLPNNKPRNKNSQDFVRKTTRSMDHSTPTLTTSLIELK